MSSKFDYDRLTLAQFRDEKVRIVLKFVDSEVPGMPYLREQTIVSKFCEEMIGRSYDWKLDFQQTQGLMGDDLRWMVLDMNVCESDLPLNDIPHLYYRVGYEDSRLY